MAALVRGHLGDIPSMDYIPKNSISVVGTNVLNQLGFSCEINYQKTGDELKLIKTATKFQRDKLILEN